MSFFALDKIDFYDSKLLYICFWTLIILFFILGAYAFYESNPKSKQETRIYSSLKNQRALIRDIMQSVSGMLEHSKVLDPMRNEMRQYLRRGEQLMRNSEFLEDEDLDRSVRAAKEIRDMITRISLQTELSSTTKPQNTPAPAAHY